MGKQSKTHGQETHRRWNRKPGAMFPGEICCRRRSRPDRASRTGGAGDRHKEKRTVDELKTFFEGIAVPMILSIFGGMAKAISHGFKTWRQFVGSLFVSGFAGMLVHLFIQDADISPSVSAALVGLSGYSGVAILDGLSAWLQKNLEKLTGQDLTNRGGEQSSPCSAARDANASSENRGGEMSAQQDAELHGAKRRPKGAAQDVLHLSPSSPSTSVWDGVERRKRSV